MERPQHGVKRHRIENNFWVDSVLLTFPASSLMSLTQACQGNTKVPSR